MCCSKLPFPCITAIISALLPPFASVPLPQVALSSLASPSPHYPATSTHILPTRNQRHSIGRANRTTMHLRSTTSSLRNSYTKALEAECAAEEASLRAATTRDRQRLGQFEIRAAKLLQELREVSKSAEEAVFDMDRWRVLRCVEHGKKEKKEVKSADC